MTDALTSLSLRNFRCSHQGARCALIFPFFFAALGRLDYRLRQVFRLFSVSQHFLSTLTDQTIILLNLFPQGILLPPEIEDLVRLFQLKGLDQPQRLLALSALLFL